MLILTVSTQARPLYLVIGETGAGKSSFVNWLAGSEIAKEGHSYESETSRADTYTISQDGAEVLYIDTPGWLDTNGLTAEKIIKFIQIEILRHKEKLESNYIAGILIILDGTSTRIRIGENIEKMIRIFGESSLNSAMIVINKFASIPKAEIINVINSVTNRARSIKGANSIQIGIADTKQPLKDYLPSLKEQMKHLAPFQIDGINELEQRVELYLKHELENEDNYEVITYSIPRVVVTPVVKTVSADEPYSFQCNCRSVCEFRLIICIDEIRVCDQCWATRKISKSITEQVRETFYDTKTVRRLRNEEKHYRELAKNRLFKEIWSLVYNIRKNSEL